MTELEEIAQTLQEPYQFWLAENGAAKDVDSARVFVEYQMYGEKHSIRMGVIDELIRDN